MKSDRGILPGKNMEKEKILLLLLPFWSPLVPPMGISCLKSYLRMHHYKVKAVDVNTKKHFRVLHDRYFDILWDCVPGDNRGNFYSIGQDVLKNHLMVHLNHDNPGEYIDLVKILVYKTFYFNINERQISCLNEIIEEFYVSLEGYLTGLLNEEKPAVLGLSLYSGTLPASMFAARFTRESYPGIKIFVGGGVFSDQLAVGTPNLDFFLEKTKDYIDKIVIGEGEILFLRLLRGELPGEQRVYTANNIDWQLLDLAAADIPDFSDLEISDYPYIAAYTSRSCPFQCSFCSETLQWGRYRKKKQAQVVKELMEMYRKYNYQLFYMCDSLLNPIINDLARELIKLDVFLYWDGCIRIDKEAADTGKTFLWRRGGFYRARIGVESGSQRLLDLMNKKIKLEDIKKALISLARSGIKTSTLWVIGHPGETETDFQQTLNLIEELKDYIYEVEGTPFWYHLEGQVNSSKWLKEHKRLLLYPETAKDMLISQTWIIDCEPKREEIYRRLGRFIKHQNKLGIPNPYSLRDIFQADERWKKLHKNAVPPLLTFADNYIDENKNVKELVTGRTMIKKNANFNFG